MNQKFLKWSFLIIVTCIFAIMPLQAQELDYPTRSKNKLGIGLYLGGPEFLASGAIDYFFTSTTNIELGFIRWNIDSFAVTLAHIGFKYFFYGDSQTSGWSPYLGIMPGWIETGASETYILASGETETRDYSISTYRFTIPLGMEYVGTSGFTLAFEVEYQYIGAFNTTIITSDGVSHTVEIVGASEGIWGGVKIGWHF